MKRRTYVLEITVEVGAADDSLAPWLELYAAIEAAPRVVGVLLVDSHEETS